MLKNKSTAFKDKFKLLDSQPLCEDISWSSSDSSDYENSILQIQTHSSNKVHKRKRKRKNKVPKNISNLDITLLDNDQKNRLKSPILPSKVVKNNVSPILKSPTYLPHCEKVLSNLQTKQMKINKSPILPVRCPEPLLAMSTKRKLFYTNNETANFEERISRSPSPVLICSQFKTNDKKAIKQSKSFSAIHSKSKHLPEHHIKKKLKPNSDFKDVDTSRLDLDVSKRIQYFDSNFSSQSLSQHSIIELQTQKDSSSSNNVDIEFTVSLTQVPSSNRISSESVKREPIDPDTSVEKSKKAKYKKDGLAFRLNAALKKQSASLSLFRHERYLAANSNFVMPKEDCRLFHVTNVVYEFGSHLLEVVDINDEIYFIFINSYYLNCSNFVPDMIFKLFEPYRLINVDSIKMIVNVSKYDCIHVKTNQ